MTIHIRFEAAFPVQYLAQDDDADSRQDYDRAATVRLCVSANAFEAAETRHLVHGTGERNVHSLLKMVDCIPVLMPPVGMAVDVEELCRAWMASCLPAGARMSSHIIMGGRSSARESLIPAAMRWCCRWYALLAARVPVFGICRGIQEINVALGGSLHYRIHQVPGKKDHRRPQREDVTPEEVFRLNHVVKLTAGGLFQRLTGTR